MYKKHYDPVGRAKTVFSLENGRSVREFTGKDPSEFEIVDDPAFEGVVKNGFNGLLAKSDPVDFSDKIVRLLENPDLGEELSQKAKKFANENFSVEQQVEGHLRIYQEAVQSHKNRKTQAEILKKRFSAVRDFLKLNQRIAAFKEVLTKEL